MKKKFLRSFIILAFFAIITLPGCEYLEDCGTCYKVTEYSDGTTEDGTPLVVCGDLFETYSTSTPTTILGVTTWWVCE